MRPSSSLFWDLWCSWQSLLDFRTSEPHSSGCGRRGNTAWEAEPCQRWVCSFSGQTHLPASVVGSSCAVVQGHLWNRLGQSNRISEHTERLQAFEGMLRKKRMLWYLYSRRIQRCPCETSFHGVNDFTQEQNMVHSYEFEWEKGLCESSRAVALPGRAFSLFQAMQKVLDNWFWSHWEVVLRAENLIRWEFFHGPFFAKGPEFRQSKWHITGNPKEIHGAIYRASG